MYRGDNMKLSGQDATQLRLGVQETTYHEQEIRKTLYNVTSVYMGEISLAKALEDLIARRILQQENYVRQNNA